MESVGLIWSAESLTEEKEACRVRIKPDTTGRVPTFSGIDLQHITKIPEGYQDFVRDLKSRITGTFNCVDTLAQVALFSAKARQTKSS